MSQSKPGARADSSREPGEELILAALERAVRHRIGDARAAATWSILDHLAVPRRSGDARRVKAALARLHRGALIERSHPHGVAAWELTPAGWRRLRRAVRAGSVPPLPESPQHREWRNARTTAAHELDRFAAALRVRLQDAALLLEAGNPVASDAWFELAAALQRSCRRLGSANHCLHEWAEPSEETADLDTRIDPGDERLAPEERHRRRARRSGRRNVRLWREAE